MSDIASRARTYFANNPGGVVPASDVAELADGLSIDDVMEQLIPIAAEYAQPEVSGYKVGAVGLGTSGALILGANFEFAGAPLAQTVHGEQCVVANAVGASEVGLTRIAISAPPCGHCRQFLNEIADAERLVVVVPGRPPTTLPSLLPNSFGPRELGVDGGLMQRGGHKNKAPKQPSKLGAMAIAAANESYAPYSKAPAGLAVELSDGVRFSGGYMENAAFNPSLPPFQATIAQLVMAGYKTGDIIGWASAELNDAPIDHFASCRILLATRAPLARGETILLTTGETL